MNIFCKTKALFPFKPTRTSSSLRNCSDESYQTRGHRLKTILFLIQKDSNAALSQSNHNMPALMGRLFNMQRPQLDTKSIWANETVTSRRLSYQSGIFFFTWRSTILEYFRWENHLDPSWIAKPTHCTETWLWMESKPPDWYTCMREDCLMGQVVLHLKAKMTTH